MEWPNILVAVCTVVTTVSALIGYIGKRMDKIQSQLDIMNRDIRTLDTRLSRLEGYIERDLVDKAQNSKSI